MYSFSMGVGSFSHTEWGGGGSKRFPHFKQGARGGSKMFNPVLRREGGGAKSFRLTIFPCCSPHLPVITDRSPNEVALRLTGEELNGSRLMPGKKRSKGVDSGLNSVSLAETCVS